MKLWVKIFIALFLGVVLGLILGPKVEVLKPLGTLFLNLINMIILPLILSSMTVGITSIHDPKKLGRVGLKTLSYYLVNTLIAICLGLSFGTFFALGNGMGLPTPETFTAIDTPGLKEILISIIPKNPIQSLVKGDVLQVIIFSVFLGLSINFAGKKARPIQEFLESLADVMYKMTSIVMEFSPIGVFVIMGWVAGTFGAEVLIPLGKFLFLYYGVCALHLGVVFVGLLYFVGNLSPRPFFKGIRDVMAVAFTTCSSSAALPVSMSAVQENLGVSRSISGFVLPLGSTVNMAGAAIYQAMSAIFISNAYGIHLDLYSLVTIVVTAVFSAVGAAGIPGSGFIMLSAVLSSVGLPLEGLALLAGIDRIREMASALINSVGDAVIAVVIAQQEGELDLEQYNSQLTYTQELSEA